jgi:Fe2+ or Zn2+ uptake regulation protein
MKVSKYKHAILGLFDNHHTRSIQSIYEELNKPDFSTVYRNIKQLCDEGILKKVYLDAKTTHYELASHCHGHFFCKTCKKVEALQYSNIHTNQGIISDITVIGICTLCKKM